MLELSKMKRPLWPSKVHRGHRGRGCRRRRRRWGWWIRSRFGNGTRCRFGNRIRGTRAGCRIHLGFRGSRSGCPEHEGHEYDDERNERHGFLQAYGVYAGPSSEQARWSFLGTRPRTVGTPLRIGRIMDVGRRVARIYGHIVRRHPHRTGTSLQTMKIIDSTIVPSAYICRRSLGTHECTVPSGHDHHGCSFRSCHPNKFRISEHRTHRLQYTASVSPSASDYRDACKPPESGA